MTWEEAARIAIAEIDRLADLLDTDERAKFFAEVDSAVVNMAAETAFYTDPD